jgi:hypothetical protein
MAVGDKCIDVSELATTDPQRLVDMIKGGRLSLITGKLSANQRTPLLQNAVLTGPSDCQRNR